jgi:hypothetical protein
MKTTTTQATSTKLFHLFRRPEQCLPANSNSVPAFCSVESIPGWLYTQAAARVVARRARFSPVAFNEKVTS